MCETDNDCLQGQECVNGTCQTVEPEEPTATISNMTVEEKPQHPGSYNIDADITNDGPVAWTYYVQLIIRKPDGTQDSDTSPHQINTGETLNYSRSYGPAQMEGDHTVYLRVWKESSKLTKIAEQSKTFTYTETITAAHGLVQLDKTVYYSGDNVYASLNIENTASVTHTFYVGCTLESPSGFLTDSSEFCCGSWTGSPDWYCTYPCNIPNNGLKAITLNPGESTIITFQDRLGPNTELGTHKAHIAVWESSDMNNRLSEEPLYNIFDVAG